MIYEMPENIDARLDELEKLLKDKWSFDYTHENSILSKYKSLTNKGYELKLVSEIDNSLEHLGFEPVESIYVYVNGFLVGYAHTLSELSRLFETVFDVTLIAECKTVRDLYEKKNARRSA